jgi:hypothetical protein
MNEQRVDGRLFIFVSAGRICCAVTEVLLKHWEERLKVPLNLLMKEQSDKELFGVVADLDVSTFDDRAVKCTLDNVKGSNGRHGLAWVSLSVIMDLFFSAARLVTEFGVLAKVIGGQQNGTTFAIVHLGQELSKLLLVPNSMFMETGG